MLSEAAGKPPITAVLAPRGRLLSPVWLNALSIATACAFAAGLPFVAFTRLILFHFYTRGSFLLDSGLLGFLLWHNDIALTKPESVGSGSFFATHMSPLFLLTGLLSRVVPCSMPQYFAGFIGFSHALLALAIFWLLVEGYGLRRGAAPWLAVLVAVAFAFSGLAIAIARYPHFETLIAAFFLLFAVAQRLGHTRLAIVFFVAGLLTREDAGLHYLAILGLLAVLNCARGIPLVRQRANLIFALAGASYVIVIMIFQHSVFPGDSSFARVYLGEPPLAHMTASLMANRFLYFIINRPYVLLPAIGACLWAARTRDPNILLGYAAAAPWLGLNLMAESSFAGALASYYAFPFLIALAWPLLAASRPRQTAVKQAVHPIAAFAALLALTFVPAVDIHDPGRLPLPRAFLQAPSLAQQTAIDRAVAAISAARPALGRLLADNSIAALDPAGFAREQVPALDGPDGAADTVAFFSEGYDADRLRALAENDGLVRRYAVPGTPLHLASRLPLDSVPELGRLLGAD